MALNGWSLEDSLLDMRLVVELAGSLWKNPSSGFFSCSSSTSFNGYTKHGGFALPMNQSWPPSCKRNIRSSASATVSKPGGFTCGWPHRSQGRWPCSSCAPWVSSACGATASAITPWSPLRGSAAVLVGLGGHLRWQEKGTNLEPTWNQAGSLGMTFYDSTFLRLNLLQFVGLCLSLPFQLAAACDGWLMLIASRG